jgi:hypothetical protein
MRRIVTTVTGVANSAVIPVDYRAQVFNVGIEVVVSATATYNVQVTLDDIQNSAITPTWFALPAPFTAATANAIGSQQFPVSAFRLNVTASTGSVTLTLLQASGQG